MLSGYDFSSCDIPVRFNHFFFFFPSLFLDLWIVLKWMWRFSKDFLSIRQQEAVLRKAVLWRRKQSKCNDDRLKRDFLFKLKVRLGKKKEKIKRKKKKKKKTKKKKKARMKIFYLFFCFVFLLLSVRCWVLICDVNQKHKTVLERLLVGRAVLCAWHETWGQPVQPVQQTITTARPWQAQRDNLIQTGGTRRGREGGTEWIGACGGGAWRQTCAQEEERKEKKIDFGRTFLKLCWVMIGWLPPLPLPATDTDSRYTSFTYMTIFTLHWLQERRCSVRISSRTKTERKRVIVWEVRLIYRQPTHTAGRGSDVTSALTVLLSSRGMFSEGWWSYKMAMTSTAAAVSRHRLRPLEFHD